MPWTDWQFWITTVAAVWGMRTLYRQIVPSLDANAACGGQAPCQSCVRHREPATLGGGSDDQPRSPLVVLKGP